MPPLKVVFTEREQQVMKRFLMGDTEEAIAEAMGIERETVAAHLEGVMRKLSLHLRLPDVR